MHRAPGWDKATGTESDARSRSSKLVIPTYLVPVTLLLVHYSNLRSCGMSRRYSWSGTGFPVGLDHDLLSFYSSKKDVKGNVMTESQTG